MKMDCPVFDRCGGCQSLDVAYEEQLAGKQAYIEELFSGFGPETGMGEIIGCSRSDAYRDKVISPFVRNPRWKRDGKGKVSPILTGMYERGTHNVIEVDGCVLENPIADEIVKAIKAIMLKYKIEPYDEDKGTGFLRHVLIRIGHESDEVLVTLVTNTKEFPFSKSFCKELLKRVPSITTIVQNVNLRQTNVILGETERTLYGPGFILDTISDLSFRISSRSFYQINRFQTRVLYEHAIELADLEIPDTFVVDAYCGTGTLGLMAAKRGAMYVVGIDSVESSIKDARLNARHNGIGNATFICDDATDFLLDLSNGHGKSLGQALGPFERAQRKVLLLDPPRSGSTEAFLKACAKVGFDDVVYVSCNPKTQARDAEMLCDLGYRIRKIQPIDMFPHTPHIENIVLFSLR